MDPTIISSRTIEPSASDLAAREGLDISYFAATNKGAFTFQRKADKLESVTVQQVTDVLSEGEIDGLSYPDDGKKIIFNNKGVKNVEPLKAIFLNDVPVVNGVGSYNYNRVAGQFDIGRSEPEVFKSAYDSKTTNPTRQQLLSKYCNFHNTWQTIGTSSRLIGFNKSKQQHYANTYFSEWRRHDHSRGGVGAIEASSAITSVGEGITLLRNSKHIKGAAVMENNANAPFTHYVTNENVDAVKLRVSIDNLAFHHDGQNKGSIVNYIVSVGYDSDAYYFTNGGSIKYYLITVRGKCSSAYVKSYFFDLPPSFQNKKRFIKIFAIHSEPAANAVQLVRVSTLVDLSEIILHRFNYPNTAVATSIYDARAFSNPPKRTFSVRLKKVNVPSNYDPETKIYTGDWDGNFSSEKKWTDNPAWIFYDLATNTRYGAGKFGFADYFIDKWNLYKISKYCDELVPTGYINHVGEYDFTVAEGDGVITVSSKNGESLTDSEWSDIFPDGSEANFVKCVDSNGVVSEASHVRLIMNGAIADGSRASSQYTFMILRFPVPQAVFKKYPEIKNQYLSEVANSVEDGPSQTPTFFLTNLIRNANRSLLSEDSFLKEYTELFPLDESTASGKVTRTVANDNRKILEARFRCNLYFDKRQSAMNALNDIASIFRGIIYFSNSYIFASADRSAQSVMFFTNANVEDGSFIYSGSAFTARATVAVIRYNDENDDFKPKIEYLENAAGLRQYGYREKDVIALGVTSRSQAQRLAKWLLYTDQTENEVVQFSTGQEATYLKPGDVIEVQDNLRTVKRYGGRIVDIDYATRTLTLDEGIEENIVGQSIVVITPRENLTPKDLNQLSLNLEVGETIEQSKVDSTRENQTTIFTITSVSETNKVTVSNVNSEEFNLIQKGFIWAAYNNNSEYEIAPVKYRVLGVSEKNHNSYGVNAMMYNSSKFGAIENRNALQKSQSSKSLMFDSQLLQPTPIQAVDGVSVQITTSLIDPENDLVPNFDLKFNISETRGYRSNYRLFVVHIDFSELIRAQSPAFDSSNTGGYILEIQKESQVQRVVLDGYDSFQSEVNVLMGTDRDAENNVSYSVNNIYRYNNNKTLENTNLA